MKRLGKIVSIVPVIAKADTLTIEERQEFKERVRKNTHTHTDFSAATRINHTEINDFSLGLNKHRKQSEVSVFPTLFWSLNYTVKFLIILIL